MEANPENNSRQQMVYRAASEMTAWLRLNVRVAKQQNNHGDKRIQAECQKAFESFSSEVKTLCHKFEAFMSAIRPIGSSSGLISTSKDLQKGMDDVLDLFRSNSAEIWREFSLGVGSNELPRRLQASSHSKFGHASHLLPCTMYGLAEGLREFLEGLRDIPEFSDKRLTDALFEFREWLIHRAHCIFLHRGSSFVWQSTIRQYINQLMKEMSPHISKINVALANFVKEDVSLIQRAQEKSQTRLQNMSTVATFLSAVTASTLQYDMSENNLKTVVQVLWMSSLILSLASAINSQLAIHWRAAMYRSPRSALPLWISVCVDHAPLFCLVLAVLAFSAGLIVWTFAANLATSVKICAATMTCVTFLVLLTIIVWEIIEWGREKSKQAAQAPVDTELRTPEMQALHDRWQRWRNKEKGREEQPYQMFPSHWDMPASLFQKLQPLFDKINKHFTPDQTFDLPRVNSNRQAGYFIASFRELRMDRLFRRAPSSGKSASDAGDEYDMPDSEAPMVPPVGTLSPARVKFHKVIYKLIVNNRLRRRFLEQSPVSPQLEHQNARPDEIPNLRPVFRLPIFHHPEHDIHFSPDGEYLAVSKLDGNLAIWKVGQFDSGPETIIPCPVGRFLAGPLIVLRSSSS